MMILNFISLLSQYFHFYMPLYENLKNISKLIIFRSLESNKKTMSLNLQNKLIYASVSRSQLPANIKDYSCELIIEEDIEVIFFIN